MKGGGFSQNEEVIVMFMGQYEHSIDAKGRLSGEMSVSVSHE